MHIVWNEDLVTERTHKRILKQVNREIGVLHRNRTLKKHFENNAETRPGGAYGYEARTKKYQIRKAKKKGHQKPLSFSGTMQRNVTSTSRVTATQHKWRVYARIKTTKPLKPLLSQQIKDELEAVAEAEIDKYISLMEKRYVQLANQPQNRRKRRKKLS